MDEILGQIQLVLDDFDDDGTAISIELTPQSVCATVRATFGPNNEERTFCGSDELMGGHIQRALGWLVGKAIEAPESRPEAT